MPSSAQYIEERFRLLLSEVVKKHEQTVIYRDLIRNSAIYAGDPAVFASGAHEYNDLCNEIQELRQRARDDIGQDVSSEDEEDA
ncbi:hypothetical protein TRAPUB_6014 [Trametes pubescens]|uniref:Uncharacterized protein n=1 Tax=Trametes pubescens TaxID=154538 RepID=A0A1M2V768_TRAPU|nr:hypothetical protein TRAPUB_6014 [Trametes pubescens]